MYTHTTIKSIKVLQHNVLNWRTNKEALILNYTKHNPDILLLNSHGLKTRETLKIPGYHSWKVNYTQENNDGSAILIKHGIQYKLIDDFDTDFIAIKIDTVWGPIIIATTYLPPRRAYLPFTDIYKLINYNIPVFILGDFNASHRCFGNSTSNVVGRSLSQLIDNGDIIHLGPHFNTFFRQNVLSKPDKVFSNKHNYLNTHLEPGDITTSDHIPIILSISTEPILIKKPETYNYKKADWELFQRILQEKINIIDFQNKNLEYLDQQLENWVFNIKLAMMKSIPKTNYNIIYQIKPTSQIKFIQFLLNSLNTCAIQHGWTTANFRVYQDLKNEMKDRCKEEFNKNWEKQIDNIIRDSKDTKVFWNKINRLRGKTTPQNNYLKDDDGREYHTDKEKCNIMQETWSNIFKITEEEEQNFDLIHSEQIDTYINENVQRITHYETIDFNRLDENCMLTKPIIENDVKAAIKRLKNKAPGSTLINKKVLEKLPQSAITVLTNIYNGCLCTGYFPTSFKKAVIKLIPKENKTPKNPLNYRPISLLEVHGKIFEKFIQSRLNTHLHENNIIHKRQHGFRPKKGTNTAIAVTYETIANALAEKKQVVLTLRDVAKAFDKVWHTGLKYKIMNLDLPPLMNKILCNFLDNRTAKIQIGAEFSNQINLLSGVPQGSVLSPILYSLYTNDLPPPTNECIDTLYADDISQVIITPSKSKKMMKHLAQREIGRVNSFEKLWKIQTSEEKFKIIPIAQIYMEELSINNKNLRHTTEGTLLGLKIQARGVNKHILEKVKNGNGILTKLRRFSKLTPHLKTTLVKTLLTPVLEYPPIPLCSATKTQLLKLQRVQNKALRFINYNDDIRIETTKELHEKYNFKPINISLHDKAKKVWETLRYTEEDTYENLTRQIEGNHTWFPRTTSIINSNPPLPIYTGR